MDALWIDLMKIKKFCEFALQSLSLCDFYSNFVYHTV